MRRPNARKVLRDELESTWTFWPAERPLTKHDLAAPSPPEAGPDTAPEASPPPREGTS